MAEQTRERWRELCELAILETDPIKVAQLFHQIDELLSQDADVAAPEDGHGPMLTGTAAPQDGEDSAKIDSTEFEGT